MSPEEQTVQENVSRVLPGSPRPKPIWLLNVFPLFLAGALICMGILSLESTPETGWLIWVPPAILVLIYLIAFWPEAVEKPMEYHTVKRPVAAKPAAVAADSAPVVETAAAPAEKAAEPEKPAVPLDTNTVVILWGSETGTAQGLAEIVETRLTENGQAAKAMSMGDVKLSQLQGVGKALFITSTWGDGEPPANAIDLWETLQKDGGNLSNLHFSVLSLGDTAYPQFCQCGKDFDRFLEAKGAKRIHPRVDCDLHYEALFEEWYNGVSKAVQKELATV